MSPPPQQIKAESARASASASESPTAQDVSVTCTRILDEVSKVIVGKRDVQELLLVNLLSSGNVLFEDFPGLAKSLIANTFSQACGCDFKRIQFTPDLLPSDITGIYIYNQDRHEFTFRPGPVFTNFLLADEINRAPPKTQAALLETMQERQVTIEGRTHKLGAPYIVLATQNPVEQEGTYPLPEAQMDRFMMRLSMGYPSRAEETEILLRRIQRGRDDATVKAVTSVEEIVAMQRAVELVKIHKDVLAYMVEIIALTREDPRVEVGSSPRGSLALLKLSRSHAALKGRSFVVPDDVKRVVVPAIAHRISLQPEARLKGIRNEDVMNDILRKVPVPKV